ncbi:MAG: lysophospholipid acyltransferase family protein [Ignavibacterium album]|uniref:lysophospholipid acyltransferase family protein n=1 Tax=Ignavibacterium album TaxID=591197 RepID=UPI0026EECBAD|nr:lysophospholipid acyltransferase family protein [Ignavibacterium album]MCX8105401.1 lysophospholipid acyltransferase family protein [Ignavibacterium album]
MNQISIREIINSKYPNFLSTYPQFLVNAVYFFFEKLFMVSRINNFLLKHNNKTGTEFIEELFDELEISYKVSSKDREKIPSEGKLIIVANHPLGGLDGLILLKLINEVRSDVKVIANDVLQNIKNLNEFFLPFDLLSKREIRKNYILIAEALKKDCAIIIFPAGEVSRFSIIKGIKDKKWNKGAVYFADKFQAPVLPVHIKGRNSVLFYLTSLVSKKFSMFLLPYELFNKKNKTFDIKIGHPISPKAFNTKYQKIEFLTKSLKKHLYLISKNKKGIFETEKNIIHPVSTKNLRKQLFSNTLIGETTDGKKIFIVEYESGKDVIREISRLRELTFRKVGEGTGAKKDTDEFDRYYKHIVLWDDIQLEIVGSYRFAEGSMILNNFGTKGFYTSTLFEFNNEIIPILYNSIELGRSFVQSKYWNSLALDYLWQGIGKYLSHNKDIRYLFGPVSLSNNYSSEAKELIIHFYSKWFPSKKNYVNSRNPFTTSESSLINFNKIFNNGDYNKELLILKSQLNNLGHSIPTLFKQYADLCIPGGVQFLAYNIDNNFSNCVDALVLLDLTYLKENKRKRYIDEKTSLKNSSNTKRFVELI